jgi:hypothetical protein
MSDCTCISCCETLERVRYFPRQLIKADDMRAEQEFFVDKLRRHNRLLHGWGVVCGLQVAPPATSDPAWQVTICPGYLVTPQGDDVNLCDPVAFDLSKGAQTPEPCCDPWPCPPRGQMPGRGGLRVVFIAVRYAECLSRPVRVHPAGCGCDETGCEHSRVRESFEIKVLWELPASHIAAYEHDVAWRKMVAEWAAGGPLIGVGSPTASVPSASTVYAPAAMFPPSAVTGARLQLRVPPVPPCPECVEEPWVVIAAVRLPDDEGTPITQADISYIPRRVLWSVSSFMALLST